MSLPLAVQPGINILYVIRFVYSLLSLKTELLEVLLLPLLVCCSHGTWIRTRLSSGKLLAV